MPSKYFQKWTNSIRVVVTKEEFEALTTRKLVQGLSFNQQYRRAMTYALENNLFDDDYLLEKEEDL